METDNRQRAQVYKGSVPNNRNSAKRIIIDWIKPNTDLLDVGCACGDMGIAIQKEKNCRIIGLEYNSYSVKIAKKTGAYREVFQCDLNNYKKINISEKFDYIAFGDVLEHIYLPQEVINHFKNFLKPEGLILISLPNIAHASIKANLLLNNFDYTQTGLLDITHIRLFTYKTIATLLTNCNLKIKEYYPTYFKGIFGTQPNDPYKDLPNNINNFILKDKHSHVTQYVIACSIDDSNENLLKHNLAISKHIQLHFV